MCLPRALNYKPDFRVLGNKFLCGVFLPGGACLSPRSAGIVARTHHVPRLCGFSAPEPVFLGWVVVSDKRQHLPTHAKQGSDNPIDLMKLLVGLWERKGLYEGSLP